MALRGCHRCPLYTSIKCRRGSEGKAIYNSRDNIELVERAVTQWHEESRGFVEHATIHLLIMPQVTSNTKEHLTPLRYTTPHFHPHT